MELLEQLRYPIGRFSAPDIITDEHIKGWIEAIRLLPGQIEAAVAGLSDDQLNTPYRPEGWTLRQVVHHVVDSHINSYCRFRWTLTENTPLIKDYDETRWALLPDGQHGALALSLPLLHALHIRWVYLLTHLQPEDWEKSFIHPATKKEIPLKRLVALYAWHGQHHTAHITHLREEKGW